MLLDYLAMIFDFQGFQTLPRVSSASVDYGRSAMIRRARTHDRVYGSLIFYLKGRGLENYTGWQPAEMAELRSCEANIPPEEITQSPHSSNVGRRLLDFVFGPFSYLPHQDATRSRSVKRQPLCKLAPARNS